MLSIRVDKILLYAGKRQSGDGIISQHFCAFQSVARYIRETEACFFWWTDPIYAHWFCDTFMMISFFSRKRRLNIDFSAETGV